MYASDINLIKQLFKNNFDYGMQLQGDIGEGLVAQNSIVHFWKKNEKPGIDSLKLESLTNPNFWILIYSNGEIKGRGHLFFPDYYIFNYNNDYLIIRDINNPDVYLEIIFFIR